jgi:predicted RecA/RadA family phage recombinase
MAKNYVQPGKVLTWTNGTGSAVSSGDVVAMGNTLGVALEDIANNASGSVAIRGVYTVPKVSGAVIAQGESLTWDVSAGAFDDNAASPGTGDITGAPATAAEAAGSGVTELAVLFTGVPGTTH